MKTHILVVRNVYGRGRGVFHSKKLGADFQANLQVCVFHFDCPEDQSIKISSNYREPQCMGVSALSTPIIAMKSPCARVFRTPSEQRAEKSSGDYAVWRNKICANVSHQCCKFCKTS